MKPPADIPPLVAVVRATILADSPTGKVALQLASVGKIVVRRLTANGVDVLEVGETTKDPQKSREKPRNPNCTQAGANLAGWGAR